MHACHMNNHNYNPKEQLPSMGTSMKRIKLHKLILPNSKVKSLSLPPIRP